MKTYKHKSKTPACCNTCAHVRKPKSKPDYRRCSIGIAMPTKKGVCKKHQESVVSAFIGFMKSEGAFDDYLRLYNKKSSVQFRKDNNWNKEPLDFISSAFTWPINDWDRWYFLDAEWEQILNLKYTKQSGVWLPK